MKTLFATAAVALVAVTGLSIPAFANDDDGTPAFDETSVLSILQGRGYNAVDAEKWGDRILAEVKLADGSTVQHVFDVNTYEPLDGANRNTRVLTAVDVGLPAAPAEDTASESIFVD